MWITPKKVIHKKKLGKSRVSKSYPHSKLSYPQLINKLSTKKIAQKMKKVIHIESYPQFVDNSDLLVKHW